MQDDFRRRDSLRVFIFHCQGFNPDALSFTFSWSELCDIDEFGWSFCDSLGCCDHIGNLVALSTDVWFLGFDHSFDLPWHTEDAGRYLDSQCLYGHIHPGPPSLQSLAFETQPKIQTPGVGLVLARCIVGHRQSILVRDSADKYLSVCIVSCVRFYSIMQFDEKDVSCKQL